MHKCFQLLQWNKFCVLKEKTAAHIIIIIIFSA